MANLTDEHDMRIYYLISEEGDLYEKVKHVFFNNFPGFFNVFACYGC